MSDWPSDRKPEPPGPIMVKLDGPPIEPQTQQIFGSFVHSKVVGIIIDDRGIHVAYENGTKMVFGPIMVP